MVEGKIVKALSGFYYVQTPHGVLRCRARGKFRLDSLSPLVGDFARAEETEPGSGYLLSILPRRNEFVRPAVANVDAIVILASAVNPVTDPFLVDRVTVIAEHMSCGVVICISKSDLDPGDSLYAAFSRNTGYPVLRTSAETGAGIAELRTILRGKTVAFTGNSGVGKSSLLNRIAPGLGLAVGEVSERLGRGRHTTRHIELFAAGDDTYIADTPGFSAFDLTQMQPIRREELQNCFPEFRPFLGRCRFDDCMHLREPGCAVRSALDAGEIAPSRYESYEKLYAISAQYKDWEQK